jgi:hypothetical protein
MGLDRSTNVPLFGGLLSLLGFIFLDRSTKEQKFGGLLSLLGRIFFRQKHKRTEVWRDLVLLFMENSFPCLKSVSCHNPFVLLFFCQKKSVFFCLTKKGGSKVISCAPDTC